MDSKGDEIYIIQVTEEGTAKWFLDKLKASKPEALSVLAHRRNKGTNNTSYGVGNINIIAISDGRVCCIFNLMNTPCLMQNQLKDLLTCSDQTKVLSNCSAVTLSVKDDYDFVIENIFDVAIGYFLADHDPSDFPEEPPPIEDVLSYFDEDFPRSSWCKLEEKLDGQKQQKILKKEDRNLFAYTTVLIYNIYKNLQKKLQDWRVMEIHRISCFYSIRFVEPKSFERFSLELKATSTINLNSFPPKQTSKKTDIEATSGKRKSNDDTEEQQRKKKKTDEMEKDLVQRTLLQEQLLKEIRLLIDTIKSSCFGGPLTDIDVLPLKQLIKKKK